MTINDGVLFDPGYSKFITSFMDFNSGAVDALKSIRNPNQKVFKYQMLRGQIISTLMREIGFYYGCLMWATYIKNQYENEPKVILNNSFYGKSEEELNEYDYLREVNYVLDFFIQYPKDLKYYRNNNKDIDEKYKKVVNIYKKFLILNKSFANTKTTDDLFLPDEIKQVNEKDLKQIKSLIDETINDGDFNRLYEFDLLK